MSRRYIGYVDVVLLAAVGTAVAGIYNVVFGLPFLVVNLFRVINMMRFSYGRMNDVYLYKTVRQTSKWLVAAQILIVVAWQIVDRADLHFAWDEALLVAAVLQGIVASVGLWSLIQSLRLSRPAHVSKMSDDELPTLTVAIPARNETAELAECLRTFVASDYLKLEILVLDDCSQDKTSDIIKRFAHDGVRFVRGDEPGDTWLAKNAAYHKLWQEASSEYVLFCGVDVRVRPDTLRHLVSYAKEHHLKMVSMLPLRQNNVKSATIAQQVRYMWELALPRFLNHRPPVLSTLWLVERDALKRVGGFTAVKRKVVPEGYFAQVFSRNDSYAFLRANSELAVTSAKTAPGQRRTTLRVRYPQLHRRPEVVLGVVAFEIVAIVGAIPLCTYAWLAELVPIAAVCTAAVTLQVTMLVIISRVMRHNWLLWAVVQGLFAVPYDLWLMVRSMYGYEFDEMYWKERNVCLPVMHVVASLPKLED